MKIIHAICKNGGVYLLASDRSMWYIWFTDDMLMKEHLTYDAEVPKDVLDEFKSKQT